MSPDSLALFAAALLILFFTPGPGNIAMVARTLDAGPVHGFIYGAGIITGDIFWFTVAVSGLTAVADRIGPAGWIFKIIGVAILLWFSWKAFQSFRNPKVAQIRKPTRMGLAATYLAGIAMPLTNPKPIIFYLTLLPSFFDLNQVDLAAWLVMVSIMLAMYLLTATVHVGLAHRARNWLQEKGVKRWADAVTALVMLGIAILLVLR
ncbi:MAG: LysE family translocator [Rhodobacterales bacterium CG15_BIG_FIL_POST_REV_8_21_14_020_59_13]|nr:MAG: LysE family translocator [Rhodobacterales bacterium CG15_BIG_FIL_POST_REV_8_21_14_020_59_13]